MFIKKIIILLFYLLLYQSPLLSKSYSLSEFNSKNLSKYFSGIVAFENKNNTEALDFFESSKILINQHDKYLKRYVMSLVFEDKVGKAINILKTESRNSNSNFFEAYILLALDSLKKDDINKANEIISKVPEELLRDRFNFIVVYSLKQYFNVFSNKKIQKESQNFGDLSLITETFQRCYLDDKNTGSFFLRLINNVDADYSRYIYFYLSYLIEKNQIEEAEQFTDELDYINATLLLSQGKAG